MHKCTEEDYLQFHEIPADYKKTLEEKKKKKMFYCLDNTDLFGNPVNMTIFGNWNFDVGRELSIVYRPCVPK